MSIKASIVQLGRWLLANMAAEGAILMLKVASIKAHA